MELRPDAILAVHLSGRTLLAALNGLAELPYHTARPAIVEIERAMRAALESASSDHSTGAKIER